MTPLISVVISCLNEQEELTKTILSLCATGDIPFELIVVDDCSERHLTLNGIIGKEHQMMANAKIVRNRFPAGIGASRHVGVLEASAPSILITDAHMRFMHGWGSAIVDVHGKDTLQCGQMVAIEYGDEDLSKPKGVYNGATMRIVDMAAGEPRYRILNPVWAKNRDGNIYELSAVMGAIYAFNREFFLNVGGLRMLRGFGCDEETLSIKWLRAGGKILMNKGIVAGHKFRPRSQAPYKIDLPTLFYNKAVLAFTCTDAGQELIRHLGEGGLEVRGMNAKLWENWGAIASEKAYLDSVFTVSWEEYEEMVERIG